MWWTILLLGCPADPGDDPKGVDADSDGYVAQTDGGDDCDDAAASVNPGATEVCDDLDVDENCDGLVDDADPAVTGTLPWSPDVDNDGYGDPAGTVQACAAPTGGRWVADATDCDDAAFPINPGAVEVCDALDTDEDCDGLADDADVSVDPSGQVTVYGDADVDGYGAGAGTLVCDAVARFSLTDDDCDDADPDIHPNAQEVCDDADTDEDCDGLADGADRSVDPSGLATYYVDADGDGYGGDESTGAQCEPGPGESALGGDCDDDDATVNPAATEICDPFDRDQDCDGLADDADASVDPTGYTTWYVDGDDDGFGVSSDTPATACDDPSSSVADYAATDDDCDDADRDINPGAREICDDAGVDEDCDGLVDSADACNTSPDTGLVAVHYAGEIHVDSSGNFVSGQFGYEFTDADELPDIDSLCRDVGDWSENGRAPTPCSSCDWAFTLEVNDTVADGDWCAELGVYGGEWDGFSAGWAFASTYTYSGYSLELVLLYQYGRSWYPIFYNYAGAGYSVGDANDLEFRSFPVDYYYLY